MTAYASAASGNWSSASTWSPSGVPGVGDTFSIGASHAVTLDASKAVGTSPAAGNTIGTVAGALVLATGAVLTIRGDVALNNAPLTMNAGSGLEFDSSQAISPSATRYALRIGTDHNQTSARLNVNGTAGNPCFIRSVKTNGAANGYITGANAAGTDWLQGGMITGGHCDVTDVGDYDEDDTNTRYSILFGPTSSSSFSIDNWVFVRCGKIRTSFNIVDGTSVSITNITMKDTISDECMQLNSPNARTSGVRKLTGFVFDKLVELYPPRDITLGGAGAGEWGIFAGGVDCTVSAGKWASCVNVLFLSESNPYGDVSKFYHCYPNKPDNPHSFALSSGASLGVNFDEGVFECPDTLNTTDAGDLISLPNPSSVQTYNVTRCLAIPNNNGTAPGVLVSMLGGANTRASVRKNTWCLTANDPTSNRPALLSVGEAHNAAANQVLDCNDNISYAPSSVNAYLVRNINGSPNNDVLSVGNANKNNVYNMAAGAEGGGYDLPMTGTPGASDLHVDPQFVDRTRNIKKWAASLGGTETTAFALAELKKKNDPTGYNAAFTVPALWTWVRDGFAPQNQALLGTAYAGGDIGAVAVIPATTPKGGALFAFGIG